jgi:hypothetical protein
MCGRRAVLVGIVAVMLTVAGLPRVCFYLLTGHLWPIKIVEELRSPATVTGWTREGLLLEDGRLVPLLGVTELPDKSEALTQATARGVELTPEGRVVGLVKVHHWCGNDPVRLHLARVDLAHLLIFLGKVRHDPLPKRLECPTEGDGEQRFHEEGWRSGDYLVFREWSEDMRAAGR